MSAASLSGLEKPFAFKVEARFKKNPQESFPKERFRLPMTNLAGMVRLNRFKVCGGKSKDGESCVFTKRVLLVSQSMRMSEEPAVHPILEDINFVVDCASGRELIVGETWANLNGHNVILSGMGHV
jgi:hypothetical protein